MSSTDPPTTTLPGTTDTTSTSSTTDTTLTTLPDTTGVLPTRGNGNIDDGEECDDGNDDDTDDCVAGCKLASCGDDFTRAGAEECDDGNDLEGDGCAPNCAREGLSIFLTADIQTAVQAKPGNSDAHCDNVAKTHFPNRTFVAWVSTKDNPVKDRLGVDKGNKYVLGKDPAAVVADNRAQLLSGTLKLPITVDQNQMMVPLVAEPNKCEDSPNHVWTGSNVDGSGTDIDCTGWSLTMVGSGTVGTIIATDAKWTNKCAASCGESHRIICVQKQL